MDTLIATAFAALFAGCWVMEMRTLRKVRAGHYDRIEQMKIVHCAEMNAMRDQFDTDIYRIKDRERSEGWEEGRQYQLKQMTRKRDKAGRFA